MSRSRDRALLAVALCALAASALLLRAPHGAAGGAGAATRLLAPLAPILARVRWVRLEQAMRAGRTELVLTRAEALLDLEARSADAHVFVSMYFAFTLASPERELDPAQRARWLRVGLEYARRGEATVADPALLVQWQGELLARAAQNDPQLEWEGGERALWSAALAHFERAAALGAPRAAERADEAREALSQARSDSSSDVDGGR